MARKKKAMDFSSLDLNLDALGDWGGDEEKAEKEFIRAAKLNLSPVTWDNAEAAADAVDYDKDYFALLSGRFIFGDFIEALVYKKELLPHRVYITTLGMSRENIDSIVNIAGISGGTIAEQAERSGIRSPAHGIWSSERSKAWHGVR